MHSSPEILGGTPVIRGNDVAASAAAGISTERILAAYPGLDAETIELATLFAQAYPPRGRPRAGSSELPTGAIVVSGHRRSRRTKAECDCVKATVQCFSPSGGSFKVNVCPHFESV